jgi:chromosome segregation ATPase
MNNSSKLTVDTSSLTISSGEASLRNLPNLPIEDELALLRDLITTHEKREEQLKNDIVQIQENLEFSKKNINRWKYAVHGDVRPGSHYRQEIVLLKEELDKKQDDIRDRDITIETLMAGNHPSHSFHLDPPVSQQASAGTSLLNELLDETSDGFRLREMERALSENSSYGRQLRVKDEEVDQLGVQSDEWENPFQVAANQASSGSQFESGSNLSDRSDSKRSSTRTIELNKELNKMMKERNSFRHKLEESQSEADNLREELYDVKLYLSNLNGGKFDPASALKHYEDKIHGMDFIIGMQKAELSERDLVISELEKSTQVLLGNEMDPPNRDSEISDLKKALNESLLELENAAEVMSEQRQTIEDLKKASGAKDEKNSRLKHILQEEKETLDMTRRDMMRKDAKIKELGLTIKKYERDEEVKDNEIKSLQQTMTFWKDRDANMQKECVKKQTEVDELSKLVGLNMEREKLASDLISKTKLLRFERGEKVDVTRQRDVLLTKLKSMQDDLTEMEKKNELLEKKIKVQASSLKSLAGEVEVKDEKIEELGKEILVNNIVISEHSELKEKNTRNTNRVDQLMLEVQDLQQQISNLRGEKESLLSSKMSLEETKKSENELAESYENQIAVLTMNKDVTINTLRNDLSASRTRSAKEVARLTTELSRMQEVSDSVQMKDQTIQALERTLHAQEETVNSLRTELRQVQRSIQSTSQQRRTEVEELQTELIETKSNALDKDRKYISLKAKLDDCRMEYEKETKALSQEIVRLNNESSRSGSKKDLQNTTLMLSAKRRLEQLKVVNIELKDENLKLETDLEQALAKIQTMKAENEDTVDVKKECTSLKKRVADLERLLNKNDGAAKRSLRVTGSVKQGKGKSTEKGTKTKLKGWGKSKAPRAGSHVDETETLNVQTFSA